MFLLKIFPNKGLIALDKDAYGAFIVPLAIVVLFPVRLRGRKVTSYKRMNQGLCTGWKEGAGLEWRLGWGEQLSLSSDASCMCGTPGMHRGTGNEQALYTRCASGNRPVGRLQLDIVFFPEFHFSH